MAYVFKKKSQGLEGRTNCARAFRDETCVAFWMGRIQMGVVDFNCFDIIDSCRRVCKSGNAWNRALHFNQWTEEQLHFNLTSYLFVSTSRTISAAFGQMGD